MLIPERNGFLSNLNYGCFYIISRVHWLGKTTLFGNIVGNLPVSFISAQYQQIYTLDDI